MSEATQLLLIKAFIATALLYAGYQVVTYLMENEGYSWRKFYQDICHACRKAFGPMRIKGPTEGQVQPVTTRRR